jgi:hypothetical protein
MAKTITLPSPKERATEPKGQLQPADMIEAITREIADRASATTAVLQEILARGDERHYATHWGINE